MMSKICFNINLYSLCSYLKPKSIYQTQLYYFSSRFSNIFKDKKVKKVKKANSFYRAKNGYFKLYKKSERLFPYFSVQNLRDKFKQSYQKFKIMAHEKQLKSKQATQFTEDSHEVFLQKAKDHTYRIITTHLRENINSSPYPYYIITLLQHIALLWYLLHPSLGIYSNVLFLSEVQMVLKAFNFHEYLTDDPNLYSTMLVGVFGYIIVEVILIALSCIAIIKKWQGKYVKYLRKIVNFLFILTSKGVSGPIMALCINIIYCSNNPYHVNQTCYTAVYISFAIVAVIVMVIMLAHIIIYVFAYYIKDPLCDSYMADNNRYYMVTKSLIKIILPVYFAFQKNLFQFLIYDFAVLVVWSGYIFWHRFNSIHSFNSRYFYFQYWLQAALFWIAATNIIYYYLNNPITSSFTFLYTFITALLVGWLLVSIEQFLQDSFVKKSIQNKFKKQQVEKLMAALVSKFIHNVQDKNIFFNIYSKLVIQAKDNLKNSGKPKLIIDQQQESKSDNKTVASSTIAQNQVHQFFKQFIEQCLKESKCFLLHIFQISLYKIMGKHSLATYKSLQLSKQKLSLIEELSLFQYKKIQQERVTVQNDKFSLEFIKFYRYNNQLDILEKLVHQCAENNSQYWHQLADLDPSIPKLRNLASHYQFFQYQIKQHYNTIDLIIPKNYYATHLYLNYLLNIAINTHETIRISEKLKYLFENNDNSKSDFQNIQLDKNACIMAIGCIGNDLGVIINSNSQIKSYLGYDKETIIGKTVNKLMPEIYGTLHDGFLLNFIDQDDSHLSLSQKFVTPLSKDFELIQTNLMVKLMEDVKNGLQFVGIMQNQNTLEGKGFMMYNITNDQVLGINAFFVSLLNGKITAKQAVQEEVKLNLILPHLKFQDLKLDEVINTILEIQFTNEESDDNQNEKISHQKEVSVILRSTKTYSNLQLAFIEIFQEQNFPQASYAQQSFQKSMQYIDNKKSKYRKRPQKMIILEEDLNAVNEIRTNQLKKQMSVATNKRMEEFIQAKDTTKLIWIVRLIIFTLIVASSVLTLSLFIQYFSYLQSTSANYLLLNQTISLAQYQAQINLNVAKIWNISANNYSTIASNSTFDDLILNIGILAQAYSNVVTVLSQYNSPLSFNDNSTATFFEIKAANESIYVQPIQISVSSAMAIYISASSQIAQVRLTSNSHDFLQMQMQSILIQKNGEQILPSITTKASQLYTSFVSQQNKQELQLYFLQKMIGIAVLALSLTIIGWLGYKSNKYNLDIINIIGNIKILEVDEMLKRCLTFLEQKKTPIRKTLSIKNQKEVTLENFGIQQKIQQISLVSESLTKKQFQSLQSSQKRRLMETQNINQVLKQKEDTPLNEKQLKVKVSWSFSNKSLVITLVIMILALTSLTVIINFVSQHNVNNINGYFKQASSLGQMRKIISYFNYLSFRFATNSSDQSAITLLNNNIQLFLKNSALNFQTLNNPIPIIKEIYSTVDTITHWLAPPIKNHNLTANYTSLSASLTNSLDKMLLLDQNTIYPNYLSQIQLAKNIELIWMILMIAIISCFLSSLYTLYYNPIILQNQKNLNMLRMLPTWLVQNNENIAKMIVKSH